MIESGSLTPGVSAEDFGLPPGTALRVELPPRALRPFVSHYHVLDSLPIHHGVVNRALPAWPMIRFSLAEEPMSVRIGPRRYDPLPAATLYGTTSRARIMTTSGGVSVGIALSPLGWARLFPRAAADVYRDQVVPLDSMQPRSVVATFLAELRGLEDMAGTRPVLDRLLAPLLAQPHPREAVIGRLAELIASDDVPDIESLAEAMAFTPAALRRLSVRYFGFPPKILLSRTRFLRTFLPMLIAGDAPDYDALPAAYFDSSHFLRDANRFLGVTPRRFIAQELGYVAAVLRAVRLVTIADARTQELALTV